MYAGNFLTGGAFKKVKKGNAHHPAVWKEYRSKRFGFGDVPRYYSANPKKYANNPPENARVIPYHPPHGWQLYVMNNFRNVATQLGVMQAFQEKGAARQGSQKANAFRMVMQALSSNWRSSGNYKKSHTKEYRNKYINPHYGQTAALYQNQPSGGPRYMYPTMRQWVTPSYSAYSGSPSRSFNAPSMPMAVGSSSSYRPANVSGIGRYYSESQGEGSSQPSSHRPRGWQGQHTYFHED